MNARLRLRVLSADAAKSSIGARLESIQSPALYRVLAGKIFSDAGVLSLTFDVRPNTYGTARTAVEPWFKAGRDTITLAMDGLTLTGQDGHNWNFEFRLNPVPR